MIQTEEFDVPSLHETLASRILFILVLQYVIAAVLVAMLFVMSARVKDVEATLQIVSIERLWAEDRNPRALVDQYEKLADRHNRAEMLVLLGAVTYELDPRQATKAVETLARAKKLDPNYWETYRTLSAIHLREGNEAQARHEGEAALRLNPLDAGTYNNLAWLNATSADPETRDLEKAGLYARKAVELTRERIPEYLDTLAEVHFRTGHRKSAMDCIRKAIRLAPRAAVPGLQARLELFARGQSRAGRGAEDAEVPNALGSTSG